MLGPVLKAIVFVATLVLLGFFGKLLWDNLQPRLPTAVYITNETNEKFSARFDTPAVFLEQSALSSENENRHLFPLRKLSEPTTRLGPSRDAAIFYLRGDLLLDPEQDLLISLNGSGTSQFDPSAWSPLGTRLAAICAAPVRTSDDDDKNPVNRVLFLDATTFTTEALDEPNPFTDSVQQIVDRMVEEEVAGADRLWVITSSDDRQRSWCAPEVGGSVFAYFSLRAMDGWAAPDDAEISLQQIFDYVQTSVARWAMDYRDSNQRPQIITASALSPAEVKVVYNGGSSRQPDFQMPEYYRTESANAWQRFAKAQKTHAWLPHQLAMIERRLVQLERARYSPVAENGRSQQIFRRLKLDAEDRLRRLPPIVPDTTPPISIQQLAPDQILGDDDGSSNYVDIWKDYLFPPPPKPVAEGETPNKAKDAPVPGPLKLLSRRDALQLVWKFWMMPEAAEGGPTKKHFAESIRLVESAVGSTGAVYQSADVPWNELQFLKLMVENVAWPESSGNGNAVASPAQAVLAAIRCRHDSDRLILGSDFFKPEHARVWPHVRSQFAALDQKRRDSEDLLIAGQVAESMSGFVELQDDFKSVANKIRTLIQINRTTDEAFRIVPVLRTFLANEIRYRKTSPETVSLLKDVKQIQNDAYACVRLLSRGEPSYDDLLPQFSELRSQLDGMKRLVRTRYESRLTSGERTASDVVFLGIEMLASSIPEWLADDSGNPSDESHREKIRSNVDRWISEQHRTMLEEWEAFHRLSPMPPQNETISLLDERKLVAELPAAGDSSLLGQLIPDGATGDGGLMVGRIRKRFSITGDLFGALFDTRNEPLDSRKSLTQWQRKLTALDFSLRNASHVAGWFESPLDVGGPLRAIDTIRLNLDRLDRSVHDLWGNGMVVDMMDNGVKPAFVLTASSIAAEIQSNVDSLSEFKNRSDVAQSLERGTPQFAVAGLAKSIGEDFDHALHLWDQIGSSSLARSPSMPADFNTAQPVTIVNRLETELSPQDLLSEPASDETVIGETNADNNASANENSQPNQVAATLNMATSLLVNRKPVRRRSLFPFTEEDPDLPSFEMSLERSALIEPFVFYRGHQLRTSYTIQPARQRVADVDLYESRHRKLKPGVAFLEVVNSSEDLGDIVFILDCSASMKRRVTGTSNETGGTVQETRFFFAREALKQAIRELGREKRFRFSVYAFGHRARFITRMVGGKRTLAETPRRKYRVNDNQGDHHPFDDCERLYAISSNDGAFSDDDDIGNIISKIDRCKPQGITPLYYSIKTAAQTEFDGSPENRKRTIIVLTDGKNQQTEGNPPSNKSLPIGKTMADLTTESQTATAVRKSGAQLFVARISETGRTAGTEQTALTQSGASKILSVNQDDSGSIADAILDAMGRNQFTLTRSGESNPEKFRIGGEPQIREQPGMYTVATLGVRTPDTFDVELDEGVSVRLENTAKGLRLARQSPPKFLGETVTCNLGAGIYEVGAVQITNERNVLAIGFRKTTNLAGSKSDNFGFRPQRVWAQVTDVTSGRRLAAFEPTWGKGQYPIAKLPLPPELVKSAGEIDVRVWIAPSIHDRGEPIADQSKENPIGIGETVIKGIPCVLTRDRSNNTSTVAIKKGDDPRDLFVNCPDFESFVQATKFVDGKLAETAFRFKVEENLATFSLSVLAREAYEAIMEDVSKTDDSKGISTDPVFGDEGSVWVSLKGIRLK